MAEMTKKKKLLIGTLSLLVLVSAVIAVIMVLRISQLSEEQETITPVAPESKPLAAIPEEDVCSYELSATASTCQGWCNDDADCASGFECIIDSAGSCAGGAACDDGFSCEANVCVADDGVGVCYATEASAGCDYTEQDESCACPLPEAVTCQAKRAYRNDTTNSAGKYSFAAGLLLDSRDTVSPGELVVYRVTLVSNDPSGEATVTDILPDEVEFVDSTTSCSENSGTVECSVSGDLPLDVAYRVRVLATVGDGVTITNTADVTDTVDTPSTCTETLTVDVAPTATPTPSPTPPPGSTPTPTPLPTATPTPLASCNTTCTVSSECPTSMSCVSGVCRNPSCPTDTDCVCPGSPTATPTPPVDLPDAGTTLPTVMVVAMGGLLVLVGMAGLIVW